MRRQIQEAAFRGRLIAHPEKPRGHHPVGIQRLGLDGRRDGLVYIPHSYNVNVPAPLVLLLHGAGASASNILPTLQHQADGHNLVLLLPDSRHSTWDVILEGFGPDVDFIDQALQETFSRYAVDSESIAIAGFSDGASYALSLGLTNGDLFGHIIAFSPGFVAPGAPQGEPEIYISHGLRDRVLPIARCSRRIVPDLEGAGYNVTYHEFDGPHTVPETIASEGVRWFLSA